ncbi:MAG TPA: lipopolysaccharide biosynthesis protein [Anaerolineales bacterium]|nr:lipopolysaccharide biosynthesis protein [Anaerolineales bacterium]
MNNLREKTGKGIFWSVIQKWGRSGIATVIFIILSRKLDPDAFGLVAIASAFTIFIELFLDQGFGSAIVQRVVLEPEHLDTAFWINILTGSLMTAGLVAASGFVATAFHEPRLTAVLRWLSISFVLSSLSSTQISILQRKLAFKDLALRSLIANAIAGVVGVGMAFAGFGVWSLVGQDLVSDLAGAIILWKASDWRPGFKVSMRHYKDLFSFGVSIVGNNALTVMIRRSDDLLIGFFLGSRLLGFYTIGYQLLLIIIRLVTEVTNSVAFPAFSRIQHQPERMRKAFYKVTQYTSLFAFPVFIGLAVLASDLVPAVFGKKWAPSIPVMQVLSLIGILQSVLFFNGSVIKASGKPSWQFGIMLLNAICSILGFLLAVRWGIVAVAASFVIVGYLLSPVSYLAVQKLIHIDFRTYLSQYIVPLTASLAMVAVVEGLKYVLGDTSLNRYVKLAVYVFAGGLSYLLVIAVMARSLFLQVLEFVGSILPGRKIARMRRTAKNLDERVES